MTRSVCIMHTYHSPVTFQRDRAVVVALMGRVRGHGAVADINYPLPVRCVDNGRSRAR